MLVTVSKGFCMYSMIAKLKNCETDHQLFDLQTYVHLERMYNCIFMSLDDMYFPLPACLTVVSNSHLNCVSLGAVPQPVHSDEDPS